MSKIKNYFKFLALLTFISLVSCEAEEAYVQSRTFGKKTNQARVLTGKDAEQISSLLTQKVKQLTKMKIESESTMSMRTNQGTIDFSSILQVIDTLGINNYTFKIINHPDDDIKTFHNLVLTEKDNQFEVTVLKYDMTDQFAQDYYNLVKSMGEFEGTLTARSLNIVADPCFEVVVPSGPGAGGGGDSPGDGGYNPPDGGGSSGGGGGSSGCIELVISYECSCGNNYGGNIQAANSCAASGGTTNGNPNNYVIAVLELVNLAFCRTYDDPCNPDGSIGILPPVLTVAELIEDKIDDSELDPCTKGILDELKNLQQSDISKIFKKLDNPNMIVKPWYNTKIVIENPINSIDALAQTNWATVPMSGPQPGNAGQSRFNYIIKVRPSYLDGTMLSNSSPPNKPTKLSIARTLLHELIHAYFDSLFDDCNPSIPGSCAEIESFEDLWQDYIINKNGGTNPNDAQHLAIAKSFTNVLARALQEYQTGIPVPDNVEPEQDYKDLAWFGLEGNPQNPNSASLIQVFNSEYPLSSDKREKYYKINNAENSQATGNVNGLLITPKSIPCD